MYCWAPPSPASWKASSGSWVPSAEPAPAGSEVVEAGMSATTQCQKPLPVGACGSYIDTTKLFVSEGNPDHDSWGEMSPPPGTPRICDSWASGSGWPSAMVSLERWNDGTSGK